MRLALILARGTVSLVSVLVILKSVSILVRGKYASPLSGELTPEMVLFGAGMIIGVSMLILQRRPRAAFTFCMIIICIGLMEGGAMMMEKIRQPPAGPEITVDHTGDGSWSALPVCGPAGYCPPPGSMGWMRYNVGGKPVHEFSYSVDARGRRNSAIEPSPERNKFLVFFGCSFTYGQGESDDKTLPHFAAKLSPEYMPYNYGVGGYGTHSMLAQIQDPRFPADLAQKSGVAVYVMVEDHIFRTMGDSQTMIWGEPMPYYALENGKPVYKGPFWKARPFYIALTRLLFKSHTARLAHIRLPRKVYTREDVSLVSAIIRESASLMKKSYPDTRFIVLLYPANEKETPPPFVGWLEEDLKGTGITLLNYRTMFTLEEPELRVPVDGHPNGVAHEKVARRMVEDLGLAGAGLDLPYD